MPDKITDDDQQSSANINQSISLQPINGQKSGLTKPKKSYKRRILQVGAIIIAVLIGSGLAAWLWYSVQLMPLSGDKQQLIVVTIKPGATPTEIGQLLEDKAIIRNAIVFDIRTRLSDTRGQLQAGTYRLSPAESTPQIIEHLVNGKVDQFSITFLPGATLKQHRQILLKAGFSASEVDKALSKTYDSPLFDGKPTGTDLEGYIYGQTYNFNAGASVEQILERSFEEYYAVLVDNNLIAGFKQHNFTIYQAITLASVIQREVTKPDQAQVAQIFYKRLSIGMELGSDVTYQYAADKLGVARDVNLDSPYNTRRYTGLPYGPIASPGLSALQAVATPASGDYLYFLSGDDNVTYFARTYAEHEANIKAHCQVKCSTP